MSTVRLKRCGPSLPCGIPPKKSGSHQQDSNRSDSALTGQLAEINDGSISRTTYAYNQAGQILETRSESEDGPFKTIYVL